MARRPGLSETERRDLEQLAAAIERETGLDWVYGHDGATGAGTACARE
jgi:hypothetical protein